MFNITQGDNLPLIVGFSADESPENYKDISVSLFSSIVVNEPGPGVLLKRWAKDDIDISEDGIVCALEQEETLGFTPGYCVLSVRWSYSDGTTDGCKKLGFIERSHDSTILAVE